MTRALLLLVMVGVAAWAVGLPRHISLHRLERRVWRHVDEVLGARKLESDRRVGRRRVVGFVSHDLAALLYPAVQYQGAMAIPGRRRRRRYVQLELARPPWPARVRFWHVRAVDLHWSSEAPGRKTSAWFDWVQEQVALALGLDPHADPLEREVDWSRHLVRLERTPPAQPPPTRVPHGVASDG